MARLVVMRGLPGAGKSTWIRENLSGDVKRRSNDQHEGTVAQRHRRTQIGVKADMRRGVATIALDNCHLTYKAIAPYLDLAERHGYAVELVDLDTPLEVCIARRPLIPVSAMEKMGRDWARRVVPSGICVTVVSPEIIRG